MKRNVTAIIAMICALSVVLTGCLFGGGGNGGGIVELERVASASGPFGAYERPVTITSVRVAFPWLSYPAGDSVENNIWKRAYTEHLNINIEYLWTVPEFGGPFDQRFNLMLATNDLPDIMPLYTTLFMRAVSADILQCLREAYETYASPRLREVMEMNDGAALNAATFDGRLLAIAQPAGLPGRSTVTIRDDWMEDLGLQAPRTIDDVVAIARAFAAAQPAGARTIPIGVAGSGTGEAINSLRPLFNSFGVYPESWVVENGEFALGGTSTDIKEPLNILAELFAEGIIDNEFAMKGGHSELMNSVVAGHVGMVFGGISGAVADHYRREGVTWTVFPLYNSDETPVATFADPSVQTFFSVSRYSQHPEALIRLLNFTLETLEGDAEWVTNNDFHTTTIENVEESFMAFFYPPFVINDPMFNARAFAQVQEALETGDTSAMNPQVLGYYIGVREHMANPSPDTWAFFRAWGPGGSIGEDARYNEMGGNIMGRALMTEVPTWVRTGQSMVAQLDTFIIRAIMNGNVEEEFNAFVNFFNTQGGADSTREINEMNAQYLR